MTDTDKYLTELRFFLKQPPNPEVWENLSRIFVQWIDDSTKDRVDWNSVLHYLLQHHPDPKLWDAIRNLFQTWPTSSDRTQALNNTDHLLINWDDSLRFSFADWMPLYKDGRITDLGQLMRSLRMHRISERATGLLKAISRSQYLDRLTRLSIYRCEEIDESAFQALAQSPYLRNIQHLEIHNSSLGMGDWYYNFASDDIDLWRKFDPSPMRVQFFDLMHSPVTAKLRWLKLTSLSLDDWNAKTLTSTTFAPNLDHLDLSDNSIKSNGATFIANTSQLQNLAVLKLSRNAIRDAGALALAHSPYLHNLQELHLVTTRITEAGRQALQNAPHLRNTKIVFE